MSKFEDYEKERDAAIRALDSMYAEVGEHPPKRVIYDRALESEIVKRLVNVVSQTCVGVTNCAISQNKCKYCEVRMDYEQIIAGIRGQK